MESDSYIIKNRRLPPGRRFHFTELFGFLYVPAQPLIVVRKGVLRASRPPFLKDKLPVRRILYMNHILEKSYFFACSRNFDAYFHDLVVILVTNG